MDQETKGNKNESSGIPPVSLLFPGESRLPEASALRAQTTADLSLDGIFDMKSASLASFFTDDPETVAYRYETAEDVMNVPEALEAIRRCVPILSDIVDLRRLGAEADTTDSYIYSITEVELYVSLLEHLSDKFLPLKSRLTSRAMTSLADRIERLTSSEGYREINERLRELSQRVREIGSVTVGVNLDSRLVPESAGLISVNSEKFRSGQTLDRILRLDLKENEYTFIAPLASASKAFSSYEDESMRKAVLTALETVFKSSFRAWRRIVKAYVLENTDFLLALLPEIEFLTKAGSFLSALKERGVPLCRPVVRHDARRFAARGLVNPVTALRTDAPMVPNDVDFDENGGIYIITGPNRGGKSVFTQAVGLAAAMASLGLPAAAQSLEMTPFDNIFCHFPAGEDDTVEKGRLGEECARLSSIISAVTKDSIVLLDESLSSTGSYEASSIASEVVAGLSVIGCRTVFSTHLHALASEIDGINRRTAPLGGVRVDSLIAGISGGERSFKIIRSAPEGKSYASDITAKYGLSLDEILKSAGEGEREE